MKKIAITFVIFASSLCAQVQLSKNVQIGGYVPPINVANELSMQSATPAAGTYIKVFPSGHTLNGVGGQLFGSATDTSALIGNTGCTIGGCTGGTDVNVVWTFTLPSYVNAANVTAVWGSASASIETTFLSSGQNAFGHIECLQGINSFALAGVHTPSSLTMQQFNAQLTGVTGAQVPTVTCTAHVSSGSPVQDGLQLNLPAIYLQLADSIDTAPADNTIHVAPQLFFNQASNLLGIDPQAQFNGVSLIPTTVGKLPAASAASGWLISITDGTSSTDCTTGGSTNFVLCKSNGSVWSAYSSASNTVNVNGSPVASPNFNGTTPVAGTNGKNITFQVSSSNVSGEIVGDGNAAHFLDGTGNYSVPPGAGAFVGGLGTSFQDVTEIAAPANPSSGVDRLYTNSSTHKLACLTSGGADCMPTSGGSGTVNSGSGYALPAYGSSASTTVGPSNITTDATGNNINIPGTMGVGGPVVGNKVTAGPQTTPPASWTFDWTTPQTTRASINTNLWACEPGLGDGTNAITAATYHQTTCYNTSGLTWTITGIRCFVDAGASSTLALTDGTNSLLASSPLTCTSSWASGTVNATHFTIASGGAIVFTFVADGTATQTTWAVSGTY